MKTGIRVKNTETGKFGHIINDSFGCCDNTEELVVYDNTTYGSGTNRELLEEISETLSIPDFTKCGAGQGADCCIFITVGSDGLTCERFTSLRDSLIFKTMNAKRHPEEPYPQCMKF